MHTVTYLPAVFECIASEITEHVQGLVVVFQLQHRSFINSLHIFLRLQLHYGLNIKSRDETQQTTDLFVQLYRIQCKSSTTFSSAKRALGEQTRRITQLHCVISSKIITNPSVQTKLHTTIILKATVQKMYCIIIQHTKPCYCNCFFSLTLYCCKYLRYLWWLKKYIKWILYTLEE